MGYLSYGYKASKTPLGKKVVETVKNIFKSRGKNPTPGVAIKTTKPGTQLTKKRRAQDEFTNFRSKLHTSAKFDTPTKNKLKMKHPLYKSNKKISDIYTPDEPKFNKGGRVGLKGGSDLGMQSVKYGLDNNPKITAADPKAKFIAANKKKKKKFDSPMAKAIKKKNKKRII